MMMKHEQMMAAIYSVLGLAMGVLSNFIGPGFLTYTVPIVVYVASLFLMKNVFKEKKGKWFFTQSVLPFIFLWIVSWIIFFNLTGV